MKNEFDMREMIRENKIQSGCFILNNIEDLINFLNKKMENIINCCNFMDMLKDLKITRYYAAKILDLLKNITLI